MNPYIFGTTRWLLTSIVDRSLMGNKVAIAFLEKFSEMDEDANLRRFLGRKLLRKIVGFHQDQESHWVATLDCGHAQHTRHDPPFFERPWVMTPAGRASRLGTPLNCVLCDRKIIPDGYTAYRRTPVFNNTTVPAGLRHQHATKAGIWGIIHVVSGTLIYRIHRPFDSEEILNPETQGIVLPEVEHDVQPTETAEFYVEFWRQSETPLQ